MKPLFSLRKRVFLNPVSTGHTSYILAEVESSRDGEYKWGHYMLTIADCRRRIQLEFFLGTKTARRISLKKINLLIDVLTRFRDALMKECDLIEKGKSRGPISRKKKA
ncbi:MAG TPA: hypothetical protein VKB05_18195 [Pyrinomonadaceae bacterium]|nr:hypothetical protein [Pyrinomonadaceae bacterium]